MALKISAKTEYACIAVMELAIHRDSPEPVRIRNISERHAVPPRFLVQILLQLKGAGIVESTRGASGGYRLKMRPEEITLGQVMNIIDTPTANGKRSSNQDADSNQDRATNSAAASVLHHIWDAADQRRQTFLDGITFAELIQQAGDGSLHDV